MMTVNEVPRVTRWLSTTLKGDATLNAAVGGRIYRGHVPQRDPALPFPSVVYQIQSFPDDVPAVGSVGRIWAKVRVIVKAIGEGNSDQALQTIADRFDAVLQAAKGGVSDVSIDYCVRLRPFYFEDSSVADKTYIHLGGEFEIAVGLLA